MVSNNELQRRLANLRIFIMPTGMKLNDLILLILTFNEYTVRERPIIKIEYFNGIMSISTHDDDMKILVNSRAELGAYRYFYDTKDLLKWVLGC